MLRKCGNILVTKLGELKLTDFGVSRSLNKNDMGGSLTEEAVGTPYWSVSLFSFIFNCLVAPEVIELKGITPAADIWSLGCTIIELITGHPPYFEMPSMSAMFRIVQDPRPPFPESISQDLEEFLGACFQKDPKLRGTAITLQSLPFIKNKNMPSIVESGSQADDVEQKLLDLPQLLKPGKTSSSHKKKKHHKKGEPMVPRSTLTFDPDHALDVEEESDATSEKVKSTVVRGYQFQGPAGIMDTISKTPSEKDLAEVFALLSGVSKTVTIADTRMFLQSIGYDAGSGSFEKTVQSTGINKG